jgi:hypothetical protein
MTRPDAMAPGSRKPRRTAALAARLAALALGAAGLCACTDLDLNPLPTVGSDAGDPVVAQPSLRNDIQPIFTARCALAGCHITSTEANLGLVLKDAATSRANLVDVPSGEIQGVMRVVPGSAAQSWLMSKLETGEMPKQGGMLSQGTRDTIRNWIDQGAQDN